MALSLCIIECDSKVWRLDDARSKVTNSHVILFNCFFFECLSLFVVCRCLVGRLDGWLVPVALPMPLLVPSSVILSLHLSLLLLVVR